MESLEPNRSVTGGGVGQRGKVSARVFGARTLVSHIALLGALLATRCGRRRNHPLALDIAL